MRLIKILGLAVAAVVTVMAFAGASPATAKFGTALCTKASVALKCPEETLLAKQVHFVANDVLLKTNIVTVLCENVLLLGDVESPYSTKAPLPLGIKLTGLTYSECKTAFGSCTVTATKLGLLDLLKSAANLGSVVDLGTEVSYVCGKVLNCTYGTQELEGHALGADEKTTGHTTYSEAPLKKLEGALCPATSLLTALFISLNNFWISEGIGPPEPTKTALCAVDEANDSCFEESKLNSVELKDPAVEFLTSLTNFKCEGTTAGSVGEDGEPQVVSATMKYSSCTNSCVVSEVSGGGEIRVLKENIELASTASKAFEIFIKCSSTVKCLFAPEEFVGHALGALITSDNGHLTFSNASLGKGEGSLCPAEAKLDALFVAATPFYIREEYIPPYTALCSKDEGNPICKGENQLKSIDWKDSAIELLTNLINVKCEALLSGSVGSPATVQVVEAEATYSGCSEGCVVTDVSGAGKISLLREGAEKATATSEGFELFVKCGTTIKCLIGPEKMAGQYLGPLTTGDNGHLTFSKVSMGKGEGATCPSEATLDALFIASSAAYMG